MKFVKVIIDGKEYYKMEEDDVNTETVSDSEYIEAEIQDADGKNAEGNATRRFFVKIGDGMRDFGEKVAKGAKDAYNKISDGAKDFGDKIKDGCERLFEKDKSRDPNSKEAKLLKLLPYMSKEEAHLACAELMADDATLASVDMSSVMPFLSTEDCDALFEKCLTVGGKSELAKMLQYVSDGCKTRFVERYIEGAYPEVDIDKLYPFLGDEQIKMLFYHIVGR